MKEWENVILDYHEKAKEIVETLSLTEKVFLMSGQITKEEIRGAIQKKIKTHYNEMPYRAGGIEEKGIPPMLFADGSRGVVCGRGKATCFPVAVMRGATFDTELEKRIGEAIGEEVLEAGANLFGGVCVNLPYHPGWGRAQESYGEDPYHLGKMGVALVQGVQSKGVIACVKHFAFNSMENARRKVNITCEKRTEREVFLPQFKMCVDAGAGAVMSAYNSYQGVKCGHHDYLLNQVLKKEWGFRGFVFSDFTWGLTDTVEAVNGGLDMEMPNTCYYGEKLTQAVRDGLVPESRIDEAALRIICTLLAFRDKRETCRRKKADYEQHRALAYRCAVEGMTLLKNERNVLPLRCNKKDKKIVVMGQLADCENIGDRGSSQVYAPYVITLLQGIIQAANGAEIIYYDGESAAHCKRLSKEADAVIIVAGNDYYDEGEHIEADPDAVKIKNYGGDRAQLGLKKRDTEMIEAVASVREDAIVAIVGGGMIIPGQWREHVAAIMLLYYPGMEGGSAFADVLFGKKNPGGKLPFVIPQSENDMPQVDWDATEQSYEYYHGYTWLLENDREPIYPFGYGLSYTKFDISDITIRTTEEQIVVTATVKNIGAREGSEVVQLYVGAAHSKVKRAKLLLKDFTKVFLGKGETCEIHLTCRVEDMAYYDEQQGMFVVENTGYDIYVGTACVLKDLQKFSVLVDKNGSQCESGQISGFLFD